MVQRIAVAAAETRSFERAAIVMKLVGDQAVSTKTIERVVHDVSPELAEPRDADPKTDDALAMRPASPPELAVVECDGGRNRSRATGGRQKRGQVSVVECDGGEIGSREPGHGPGVHSTTEGWRETKIAGFRIRRSAHEDPPEVQVAMPPRPLRARRASERIPGPTKRFTRWRVGLVRIRRWVKGLPPVA
ncbi:MAG: hypothetical protein ACYC61_22395 [Isosphaeraceae bacterium]